jgi:hypothetical protein
LLKCFISKEKVDNDWFTTFKKPNKTN